MRSAHACMALNKCLTIRGATAPKPQCEDRETLGGGGNLSTPLSLQLRKLELEKIGFGGGCHWCTEGVFQQIRGVQQVDQGFIRSDPPSDTWAEGVVVHFDPAAIDLVTLLEIHLRTHSATKTFEPAGKYRSAAYVFEDDQAPKLEEALASLGSSFEKPLSTRALPFRDFKPSDERYHNYYDTDPERPFCKRYIDPKLDYIRKNFAKVALPARRGARDAPSTGQIVQQPEGPLPRPPATGSVS